MFKGLKGKFKKEAKEKAAEASVNTLRKREVVKSQFYPLLCETSKNVEDAKVFCQVLQSSMQTAFNKQMLTQKVESLALEEMVVKNPEYDKYRTALKMLEGETVADALDIVGGMSPAIDSFIKEENTKRPLKDLKATFL